MNEPWKEEQARQEELEEYAREHLPVCEDCGEYIFDFGYKVDDVWYCEDCMRRHHYKEVEVDG